MVPTPPDVLWFHFLTRKTSQQAISTKPTTSNSHIILTMICCATVQRASEKLVNIIKEKECMIMITSIIVMLGLSIICSSHVTAIGTKPTASNSRIIQRRASKQLVDIIKRKECMIMITRIIVRRGPGIICSSHVVTAIGTKPTASYSRISIQRRASKQLANITKKRNVWPHTVPPSSPSELSGFKT